MIKKLQENDGDLTISLNNKSVRLKQNNYDKRISNNELGYEFIDWYNKNKDSVFTAKLFDNKGMYELDGVDIWTFNYYDLEEVYNETELV